MTAMYEISTKVNDDNGDKVATYLRRSGRMKLAPDADVCRASGDTDDLVLNLCCESMGIGVIRFTFSVKGVAGSQEALRRSAPASLAISRFFLAFSFNSSCRFWITASI